MALTYEPIATTTSTSNTTTSTFIEFDNIPGTYTDLVISLQGTGNTSTDVWMRFNTDTGSNYSDTRLYSTGGGPGSDRTSSQTSGAIGVLGTTQSNIITTIFDYSNTTTYKTFFSRSSSNWGTLIRATLWRSTNAITKVQIGNPYANYVASGTVVTLYGIKAA